MFTITQSAVTRGASGEKKRGASLAIARGWLVDVTPLPTTETSSTRSGVIVQQTRGSVGTHPTFVVITIDSLSIGPAQRSTHGFLRRLRVIKAFQSPSSPQIR